MQKMTDLVFNFPVDELTVDTIQTLRDVRLQVAREMLRVVPDTVDEMVKRGLIDNGDRGAQIKNLTKELRDKINSLEKRQPEEDSIYSDELELYLNLIK